MHVVVEDAQQDAAMRWVAADVAFDSPAGPLAGAAALREYMEPFALARGDVVPR